MPREIGMTIELVPEPESTANSITKGSNELLLSEIVRVVFKMSDPTKPETPDRISTSNLCSK